MARAMLHTVTRALRRFSQEEQGGGTVMALFCLSVSLLLLGLAIDVSNARRNEDMLSLTADVAAHAGAVALLKGAAGPEALEEARRAVERNMPEALHGTLTVEDDEDIALFHFDQDTKQLLDSGPANAVFVKLQRSRNNLNPLPTFLGALFGVDSWDIAARSLVYVGATHRCSGATGVYAKGGITLEAESHIGAGICLHSQSHVTLYGQSSFEPTSFVSMPNLSMCQGTCSDALHPGITPTEANVVMPKTRSFIREIQGAFLKEDLSLDAIASFFATRPMSNQLSALDEIGVPPQDVRHLDTGRVVSLTHIQFTRVREYPVGLVYTVKCQVPGEVLSIGDTPFSPVMKDIVLITDCALNFAENADVRGSIIITTHNRGNTVSAEPGATAGDPSGTCQAGLQTVIMSFGDISLPESFVRSNVVLIASGDVHLSGLPQNGRSLHKGLSVHAGGTVSLGKYNISGCSDAPTGMTPELQVIRHVIAG